MSYLVLARRWRPQRFADLVGQDVVVRTLKNALNFNSLAHAYLLTGIRGVGKTTIARLMAMSVNCMAQKDGEPCGECAACTAIAAGSHLDVQEMDAASHTGVDDIREILDGVRYPPVSLPYKVYIIDEAHMLSKSAFNALLKTLEEPPAQVLFILATTESEKLPVTVRSRCQRFDLRRLLVQEVADYLEYVLHQEGVSIESEALLTIARSADGSVRDALSLTERVLAYAHNKVTAKHVRQALGMIGPEIVQGLSNAIASGDAAAAVLLVRQAAMQGSAPRTLLLSLSELWHQLACMAVDENLIADVPSEQVQAWLKQAINDWSAEGLDLRYQVLIHGLRDLTLVDEQRGVEMIAMRLCHLSALMKGEPSAPAEIKARAPMPPKLAVKQEAVQKDIQQTVQHNIQQNIQRPVVTAMERPVEKNVEKPFAKPCETIRSSYHSWSEAVAAYSKIRPGITALLEHVICLEFQEGEVRLALDAHQKRAIVAQERSAFSAWLGRAVVWGNKAQDATKSEHVESISTVRARQEDENKKRVWQQAEQDPAVQLLTQQMDCRLIDVQPASENKT
ncbi:MAG: DNA polymerase III subunit gamma/tau [Mariprofundaceae bacterium]|nr:DNA polymerase III subunit gamma/tau [Mariprofundaceae bacterium]